MAKNLGFLTAYGIEDIYVFIGEERMKMKILEYKDKPTMGFELEEFIGSTYNFSDGGKEGPLWVMNTFFYCWFRNDLDVAIFLYEKSKIFTEENYLEIEPFRSLWNGHLEQLKFQTKLEKKYGLPRTVSSNDTINPYWIEFHCFIQQIVTLFMEHRTNEKINGLLDEIFSNYLENSEKLTKSIKKNKLMWPKGGLGSSIYSDMEQYYYEKKDDSRLKLTWEKAKSQKWRAAFYYN
jgi:hypothetical protein